MSTKKKPVGTHTVKTDGVSGQIRAFTNARRIIEPVRVLSESALEIFNSLADTKSVDDWTPAEIVLATSLAESMDMEAQLFEQIQENGPIDHNRFGDEVLSATFLAHQRLVATNLKLSRSIGVNATGADKTAVREKGKKEREAKAVSKEADAAKLLA